MTTHLKDTLTELQRHYAVASPVERRFVAHRMRELLASADHAPRTRTISRWDRAAEVDLFDNVPV